tara:strand:- start:9110 stop:9997 length:888 start_codon:yes stop_codon:yes gene_type:complete
MPKKYFDNFPTIQYTLSKTETKKAVDILRRVGITNSILNEDRNLISGFVKDGDTPQTVANFYYGSQDYYWLVLLSAKIHNPYYGWPLEYQQLRQRLYKQYPGVSLFVSSEDTAMNTKSESVNFTIGDTINVISGGSGEEVIEYSGTIYDYDLTSGHMKIKDIVGDRVTVSYNTNQKFIVRSATDPSKTGYLRRKIQDVTFSLERFQDINTKREYSPLHRYSGSTTIIETYTDTEATLFEGNGNLFSTSALVDAGIRVITVEQSEEEMNDRNRYIKIVKPGFVSQLSNEIKFALRD